jgi:hypothetical protein
LAASSPDRQRGRGDAQDHLDRQRDRRDRAAVGRTAHLRRTFQTIPLLIVASLWYLAITSVFTLGQSWLERRTGSLVAPDLSPTALQRLLAFRGQRLR